MTLSAYERETSIVLNDDDDAAHVYTAQRAMMRRLAKHPQAVMVARHEDDCGRVTGEEWDVPKALVVMRMGKRTLSQAQRDVLRRARDAARRGNLPPKPLRAQVRGWGGWR